LEKELEGMRRKHAMLFDQVVTRGEASMAREAATGECGMRLPNGEMMTPEKFMNKTKMMNQCMESLQASEKRSRLLTEENTNLKRERDSLYTNMRKFENMLQGFERARHHDVFTDDMHKKAVAENSRLVDEIEKVCRNERELREDNSILRRRISMYKKNKPTKAAARIEPQSPEDEVIKRKHSKMEHERRRIGSEDEEVEIARDVT
jgi:hypothetical protein